MKNFNSLEALALISFFGISCEKEIVDNTQPTPEPQPTQPTKKEEMTFKATIDDNQTKTTISGTKISWASGDEVSINGKKYIYDIDKSEFVASESDNTTLAKVDGYYKAYFPYNYYSKSESSMVFPSSLSYEYVAGNYNMPMFAKSQDQTLKFSVICGVLKLVVKSTIQNSFGDPISISNVASITVSSDNNALSGKVIIDEQSKSASLESPLRPSDVVTINYTNTPTVSAEGTAFYIPLPVGNYSRLLVEVVDNDGNVSYLKTRDDVIVEITRNINNELTFINNFKPYQKELKYIQIDEDENNERH